MFKKYNAPFYVGFFLRQIQGLPVMKGMVLYYPLKKK